MPGRWLNDAGVSSLAKQFQNGLSAAETEKLGPLLREAAVKARIAEPNGTVEAATGYDKDDAVRDLVAIIRSHPAQAGPDHSLCEERLTSWGSYQRFPSKLAAITLLAKMLGWAEPAQVQVDHDPDAGFKQLAEFIRQRS